jgi:cation diffusion facilitator family transporter
MAAMTTLAQLALGGPDVSKRKTRVAFISALAAVGLVIAKTVVGWQTGSLGILSEAAHSGMDLVATLITLFAVRVADRPADTDHHYGHGKVENLSALVETGLLLLTCVWIINEAVERLLSKSVDIEPTWIAFAVVLGSMVVDFSRSRALARVARETGSQALEADALNFRTDIWGALTVLLGLVGVWVGRHWGIPWLHLLDAVAALCVAILVLVVGGRLGKRAADALLDRAPVELIERIRAAIRSVPDVRGLTTLRARRVGARLFVDATVSIDRAIAFEAVHAIVSQVEERIREVTPEASIVIHAEPLQMAAETLGDAIRLIASRHAAGIHDVLIYDAGGERRADLHLEVPGTLLLRDAHALAERIVADIHREIPRLGPVQIHVDPVRPIRPPGVRPEVDAAWAATRLKELAQEIPGLRDCHDVSLRKIKAGLWLVCHCAVSGELTVAEGHELGLELGRRARQEIPGVERVTVNTEPFSAPQPSPRGRGEG